MGAHGASTGNGAGMANEGLDPSRMTSDVPPGWKLGTGLPMRHVTYKTGGSSECYITFLGGRFARDWRANVDRWVGQIGNPRLDDAAFAAMPKIEVLGKSVPMLESHGKNGSLLAVLAAQPSRVMFVKLTGTRDDVENQRANFIAFCRSLRIGK